MAERRALPSKLLSAGQSLQYLGVLSHLVDSFLFLLVPLQRDLGEGLPLISKTNTLLQFSLPAISANCRLPLNNPSSEQLVYTALGLPSSHRPLTP